MNDPATTTTPVTETPLVETRGLSFAYGEPRVLEEVSLKIRKGESVAVLGPNGSGKSTLLKLIGGILQSPPGAVLFRDQDIHLQKRKDLARSLCWIPQDHHLAFAFKVSDIVLMGRHPHLPAFGLESAGDYRIAREAMEQTDVFRFHDRSFNAISGGEKQRVLLASAITQQPELMLLDEPTSALDLKYQVEILRILRQLNRERRTTLILAMHDLHLAAMICDRLVLLNRGRIHADGPPSEVLRREILEEVYGVRVRVIEDGGFHIVPEMP